MEKRDELLTEERLKGRKFNRKNRGIRLWEKKIINLKKFIDCLLNFQDVKDLELCDDQE